MKRLLIMAPLIALLGACDNTSPQQSRDWRSGIPVLVTEHDGVRVWKIKDTTKGGASYVYFTTLGETKYPVNCGKNCTRQEGTGSVR